MTADRVDWLINRLHVTCLALLRLRKLPAYGGDPAFLALLTGVLHHGGQLMEFIRERESSSSADRRPRLAAVAPATESLELESSGSIFPSGCHAD
jgi:hypothetical protein